MAVSSIIRTQMRLVFEKDTNPETGKISLKTKSFANVKANATPDEIYAVGNALSGLQSLPLYRVERYDYAEVTAS